MNSINEKTLFLHMGPGGNADVERSFFADRYSFVDFWNQPHVKEKDRGFKYLTESVINKIESYYKIQGEPIHVVAHSFSGLLLNEVLRFLDESLISRITMIATGFYFEDSFICLLRKVVTQKDCHVDLQGQITQFLSTQSRYSRSERFWQSVGLIMQYPNFMPLYFSSTAEWEKVANFFMQAGPMELNTFTNVANDLLQTKKEPSISPYKGPVEIYFGETDPLLDLNKNVEAWRQIYPQAQVHSLSSCGHFCHLEKESLFFNADAVK
ncbi:MAG: alpha/beta hydrolase [Bdellovibrionaceae bacterium]|nr:alpha/beta hydrolase [Pseudobdellovibrionaceae bacterium]